MSVPEVFLSSEIQALLGQLDAVEVRCAKGAVFSGLFRQVAPA